MSLEHISEMDRNTFADVLKTTIIMLWFLNLQQIGAARVKRLLR